jgi:hypothetical protein
MDNIEKEAKRLSHLTQFSDKPKEELLILAKESLEKKEILGSLTFCLETEKEFASNLLGKYLAESAIESFTDRDTLRQLIDLEIIVERIKTLLNVEYDKANKAIPLQMLDQLTSLNSQIMDLKERLGLTQKKEDKNDTVKVIDNMLERFHKWANKPENRSNFEFQCPKCSEIFLLRRELDKEKDKIIEHPWFIDGGILFNKQIFVDLDLGKISEDQAARYLNATLDYIKWIRQNYPLNQDKEQDQEKESDD